VLDGMLQFNPHNRLNANELLQSKLFDQIREPEMEASCPKKFRSFMDKMRDFNYKKNKFNRLNENDLMKMLQMEIQSFKNKQTEIK
jgi:serine/threonine protein kinase